MHIASILRTMKDVAVVCACLKDKGNNAYRILVGKSSTYKKKKNVREKHQDGS
jgi:hypothetical protein